MKVMKQKNKFTFTLVELLIVIAILLILMSLIQPSLKRAIGQAQLTVCKNQLKNMGLILHNFADDHNDHFPAGYSTGNEEWQKNWIGGTWIDDPEVKQSWHVQSEGVLWQYMSVNNAKKILRCPSLDKATANSGEGSNGFFDYGYFETFSGAKRNKIPSTAQYFEPTQNITTKLAEWDVYVEQSVPYSEMLDTPTPIIIEEDPGFFMNNTFSETHHCNLDTLGTPHLQRYSTYVAIDGSAHALEFPVRGLMAVEWKIEHDTRGVISLGLMPNYGFWNK